MNTPTLGINRQQENALQEVVNVIDEAVRSGRIAPAVRTVFNQLITQTHTLATGVPAPGASARPLTAVAAMCDIQARTVIS